MGKSTTVGFRYYMPLQLVSALSRGPTEEGIAVRDCLFGVVVGEREAWTGAVYDNSTIYLNAPDLFGGDEKEGGIVGYMDVMFGASDQSPNTYLSSVQGDPQSAHRGLFTLVYRDGQVGSNNPYLKPWAFRRRRITGGWNGECWYPEKAPIPLQGLTGAAAEIVEGFATNEWRFECQPTWEIDGYCEVPSLSADSFTLSGDGSETFTVSLSITGSVESKDYTGGTPIGAYFYDGGTAGPLLGAHNTYRLEISNPARVIHLNRSDDGTSERLILTNVLLTVEIASDATVTLYAASNDGYQDPPSQYLQAMVTDVSGISVDVARYAMNPAHIVYQCLTDPNCLGYPTAVIDEDSFTAAADQLYDEGLGLNIKWTNRETIENFVGIVCDHAGMIVVKDRRTGLYKLRLLRDDYDIEDLKVFTPSNSRVISAQRPSPADIVNELQVTYTDYRTFKEATIPVRDAAAVQPLDQPRADEARRPRHDVVGHRLPKISS